LKTYLSGKLKECRNRQQFHRLR